MKIRYLLLLCLMLVGCRNHELDTISKNIGVNVRNGEIIVYENSRGWFNDGEAYAEISLEDYIIEIEEQWNKLPIQVELNPISDKMNNIEKGYYYFDSKNENNNYILAIYDSENNKLYYIKYDS